MAAVSCGTEAEMFGNLITLAAGVVTRSPSTARSSGWRCASPRYSGNDPRMRPASEMSRVSTVTPAAFAKNRTMGRSDALASSGASSTFV
jgi:hypothetical protein